MMIYPKPHSIYLGDYNHSSGQMHACMTGQHGKGWPTKPGSFGKPACPGLWFCVSLNPKP